MRATDFAQFVAARQQAWLRFAMVLTGDGRLAQEIVADVLGRAFERWERIGAMADPNAYVRRMIVNEHLSWRRRWARSTPQATPGSRDQIVADHADQHAERDAVLVRLALLPRRQRAALVLRYYEGLPDADIAVVLECSVSTVRSHVSLALARLRVDQAGEDDAGPAQVIQSEVSRER